MAATEAFVNVNEGTGKKIHHISRTIGADLQHDEVVVQGEYQYASYTVVLPATAAMLSTANSHLLQIMAGASLNVRIRSIEVWLGGATTSTATFLIELWRLSTAGTGGTAITPGKLVTADAASGATAMTLPTVKGTETTKLYHWNPVVVSAIASGTPTLLVQKTFPLNIEPLLIPAGAANGIAIKNVSSQAAGTMIMTVEFVETNFV